MLLFDTHIHLLAPVWSEPISVRIQQHTQCGVKLMLIPGVREGEWQSMVELARSNPGILAAPGLHPGYAESWTKDLEAYLRQLCQLPEVVAIGEIGLDGAIDVGARLQSAVFGAQLRVAIECNLPVLIHCRKRAGQMLEQLQQAGVRAVGGIWHGFSGSLETAQAATALGMLIGIGPVLLRDNVRRLPVVVKALPAESLVLETDAPDMASSPDSLLAVAKKLAELRGWSLEETVAITTANACRVLKLTEMKPE